MRTFTDYKEVAIRHFLNIAFADPIPALKDFYAQQKWDDANNGSNKMRAARNLVVSHIPEVQYNQNGNDLSIGLASFIKVLCYILNF